ncbi:MAG TPA: PAS domain-containing protein [Thermoanaerobaculia bacterium]|jgi:PAS domain S-box-containing protein
MSDPPIDSGRIRLGPRPGTAEEELRHRLAFERLVGSISSDLMKAPAAAIDEVITDVLGRIGRFTRSDRSYIFLISPDGSTISNTHEWRAENIPAMRPTLQGVPAHRFAWWLEQLRAFRTIHSNVDDLPPEAAVEQASLRELQIRSVLDLPLSAGSHLIGFIGFDSVREPARWSEADIGLLGVVGELVAYTLERKRAEQRFREQDERFGLLTKVTQDTVYDWNLLTDTVWWNGVLHDALGYTAVDPLLPINWWVERIHPDDGARIAESVEQAIRGDAALWSDEYRFLRADGTYAYVLDRGGLIRDEHGHAVRMIGVMMDLSERRRAEEQLAISEEHFRSVIENITEVIAIIDEDGVIRYESPALFNALGYRNEEQVGFNAFDFIHPDDQPLVAAEFARGLQTKRTTSQVRYRYLHKDGTWRWLESSGINMVDNPAVRGIIVTSREVTQRIALEQQLEQAHRLTSLGRLAASIAHEFNNVLMGIQPFAERIRRLVTDDERVKTATEHITRAVERGRRVTSEVLQFTRVAEPVLAPVEVEAWLGQITSELRALLGPLIELDADVAPGIWMKADSSQLTQVLVNLTTNARDAMRAGGRLTMCVAQGSLATSPFNVTDPDRFVHFILSDNGDGIPAEHLPHLFDPLFTTKPAGKGTGLGLAVAHQIVVRHGGAMFVQPNQEAKGTSFHFYIPLTNERPRAKVPPVEAAAMPSLRLLLVDDEELVAVGIRDLLATEGHEVLIASTGEDALRIAAESQPDALILDISLPGMSGVAVYEELSRVRPDLPTVFSSGHGDRRIIERYIGRPHVVSLLKPYELGELLAALRRAL